MYTRRNGRGEGVLHAGESRKTVIMYEERSVVVQRLRGAVADPLRAAGLVSFGGRILNSALIET